MKAKVTIINGPNLNLLGTREPGIYGTTGMDAVLAAIRAAHPEAEIEYFQSNHEGDLIDRIHACGADAACRGIVLNAGAYTHTSLAIADAIAAVSVPVVEVHISNTAAREAVRHTSMITAVCRGVIAGLGTDVYGLATQYLLSAK